MSCFLACFGASKDSKRRKNCPNVSSRNPGLGYLYQPIQPTPAVKQENPEERTSVVIPDPRVKPQEKLLSSIEQDKPEEQLSSASHKRRVTFDSNVKEYEHVSVHEATEIIQESSKQTDKGINENCDKTVKSPSVSDGGSTLSSSGSYPSNHRYQNCRESDDEDELDCDLGDFDKDEDVVDEDEEEEKFYDDDYCDDDYHSRDVQEFSSGSCSSMESRTKCSMTLVSPEKENNTPEFNSGARDRAGYVHSVLNPVENTAQWKAVKARAAPPLKPPKENFPVNPGSQRLPQRSTLNLDEKTKKNPQVAVDASLSSWLGSSEKTPPKKATPISLEPILSGASASSHGSNSVKSHEERPILGALTVEELRHFSASPSPRRSPARSPDEKPLVGTVGVHWNDRTPVEDSGSASSFKGIPNTTSKYREDKRVNWHSTPFETRLERALNKRAELV